MLPFRHLQATHAQRSTSYCCTAEHAPLGDDVGVELGVRLVEAVGDTLADGLMGLAAPATCMHDPNFVCKLAGWAHVLGVACVHAAADMICL